jgi:hypothetical protein
MTAGAGSSHGPFQMPQRPHLLLHLFVTDTNTVGRKLNRPVKRFNRKRRASRLTVKAFEKRLTDKFLFLFNSIGRYGEKVTIRPEAQYSIFPFDLPVCGTSYLDDAYHRFHAPPRKKNRRSIKIKSAPIKISANKLKKLF